MDPVRQNPIWLTCKPPQRMCNNRMLHITTIIIIIIIIIIIVAFLSRLRSWLQRRCSLLMFPLTPDQHHWLEVATEDEGWCSFTSCTPSPCNMAQNSSDNLPYYPPDNDSSLDVSCWKVEGNTGSCPFLKSLQVTQEAQSVSAIPDILSTLETLGRNFCTKYTCQQSHNHTKYADCNERRALVSTIQKTHIPAIKYCYGS